ncbi:MAG TPA: dockerin type I domain-containing protein [Pirellulales bacterium]|nr:dockerin type I domain-containing protein [Pirellulales bacterium]
MPRGRCVFLTAICGWILLAPRVDAQTLRVVTYNIDADTGGAAGQRGGPTAGPGLTTVLQAIGAENLAGNAQPIDVLALEELYKTPTTTLQYIVDQLNAIYGAGTYAYDATTDPTTGNSLTGNGPSGLIYNTHTVQDLGAVAIGPASSSGAPRDPMRYELAPVGYGSAANFYLYVDHAKSSSDSTEASDEARRNIEAQEVRADAATLGPHAHIIYAGDWNLNGASEAAYQTLVAPGAGQAFDPVNPAGDWSGASKFVGIFTESATALQYRDDLQLISGPMMNEYGMQQVPGSYTAFGNNGTTAYRHSVAAAGNTALSDLPNQSLVLSALTTATDHLPVVADYTFLGVPGDINTDGIVNSQDLALVSSDWLVSGTGVTGDLNGDGIVNSQDLAIVSSNWGATSDAVSTTGGSTNAAAVPEPTGLLTFACGAVIAALVMRWHRGKVTAK